jgi:hypothetical protein
MDHLEYAQGWFAPFRHLLPAFTCHVQHILPSYHILHAKMTKSHICHWIHIDQTKPDALYHLRGSLRTDFASDRRRTTKVVKAHATQHTPRRIIEVAARRYVASCPVFFRPSSFGLKTPLQRASKFAGEFEKRSQCCQHNTTVSSWP